MASRGVGPDAAPDAEAVPRALWRLSVPLLIRHADAPADVPPFVATSPRFGYLASLLPRLRAYFGALGLAVGGGFRHEDVPLRGGLAVGLLADLYRPAQLPWRLEVSGGPEDGAHGAAAADAFLNAAKEADFVRRGSAKAIMGLSMDDTTALWNAVKDNDYSAFSRVNARLLNAPAQLRNVPLRVYVPSSPSAEDGDSGGGAFRVVQTLVTPRTNNRQPQTLGTALRTLLPSLFPSSRDPVLANVILHGAPVPFSAPLEELMREAAYPDGWVCLVVVLL